MAAGRRHCRRPAGHCDIDADHRRGTRRLTGACGRLGRITAAAAAAQRQGEADYRTSDEPLRCHHASAFRKTAVESGRNGEMRDSAGINRLDR